MSQMMLKSSQGSIISSYMSKMNIPKTEQLTFAVTLDLAGGITIETR